MLLQSGYLLIVKMLSWFQKWLDSLNDTIVIKRHIFPVIDATLLYNNQQSVIYKIHTRMCSSWVCQIDWIDISWLGLEWQKSLWKGRAYFCSPADDQTPELFLSTLQNTGIKILQGVEKFQQGEVLFVQAAYKFLHAAKMHFMQL